MTQSLFIKTLLERGYIHQCTDMDGLDQKMNNEVVPAYIGFDATADSLHVGSLLPIMMLRHLQKCGHKPIVLMGGATTRVGDPSGKDESRKMLNDDDIEKNITGIKKVFDQKSALFLNKCALSKFGTPCPTAVPAPLGTPYKRAGGAWHTWHPLFRRH